MRVMPISLRSYSSFQPQKNQNSNQTKQNKNISFGNFESDEAKKLTYEAAISSYANWSETKKKNFGFYDLDLKLIKENMAYLEKTPFVTVKKWNGSDGEEYAYVALNRAETDKHKNKQLFDNIAEYAQSYPIDIEQEIIAKDPDFIGVISDDCVLSQIQDKLHDAEIGFVYKPSESDNNSYKQEEDLWLKAVSREILN